MKITVLGSGSPEAYVRRASSGYMIELGADRILFDVGGGVVDNLIRAGRAPKDITHIFFSHLHSDHMMDYARLVHAAWDERGAPIKIFGPPPIMAISEGYFGANGVLAHDLRARTRSRPSQEVWQARGGTLPRPWPEPQIREISPGFSFEGANWRLSSCAVPHAQPHLECLGLALESNGRKFVYSGDAGHSAELEKLCQNADLLIHWCYRLDGEHIHSRMAALTPTPAEIAAMARRAGVGRLLLSHFRVHMDAPGKHGQALESLHRIFGDKAGVAEDLDEINL